MNSDWTLAASCRQFDPELWFSDDPDDQKAAKRVCSGCAVAWLCMDDALRTDDSTAYGIRAGLTGKQRTQMRRERERTAA